MYKLSRKMKNLPTITNKLSTLVTRVINRSRFFDIQHPEERLGVWVKNGFISLTYPIPQDIIENPNLNLYSDLYIKTIEALNSWCEKEKTIKSGEKTFLDYVSYEDKEYRRKDKYRGYILVKRITVRRTEIVSLCRFYQNINSIYVRVDSYILGEIDFIKIFYLYGIISFLLVKYLITPIIIALFTVIFIGFFNQSLALFIFILILGVVLLLSRWIWGYIIKGKQKEDDFYTTLRRCLPNKISDNSFDFDDSTIFLKTVLPLITDAIKDALKENGLENKEIEDYLNEISKNLKNPSFSINTGGGDILGSIFGGSNNRM